MVAQSPPYAAQNGSHSAALFRLATFSAWRNASGAVGAGDFTVSAQSTPNMSVQVAAGRAWMKGTQVASVSGGTWAPQGGYYGYNDAPVTLTVAAADPTNPRVDAVVAYATDSFYSGSTNTFVLGIVTGTPAATPATPATPNNGLLLGTIAVAANATSIASGNISNTAGMLTVTRGGILPVTSTDNTNGEYVGSYRDQPTAGLQRWTGSAWGSPDQRGRIIERSAAPAATVLSGATQAQTFSNFTMNTAGVVAMTAQIRAGNPGTAICWVEIDGTQIGYSSISRADGTVPVLGGATLAAGAHTLAVKVQASGGNVGFTDCRVLIQVGVAE